MLVVNMAWALRRGEVAGSDPWGADTLEWLASSPPQNYNFAAVPVIEGRHALWDRDAEAALPVVTGLRTDRREILVTTVGEAEPTSVVVLPGPTPWPFLMAVSATVAFVGSIFHPIWFVVGFFLVFGTSLGWLWPRRPWRED